MNLSDELDQDALNFLLISLDGIYCLELPEPMSLSSDSDSQLEYILQNAVLKVVNDVFARMYGFPDGKALLGSSLKRIIRPDHPEEWRHLRNFIQKNYSIQDEESLELDRTRNFRYFLNSLKGFIENGKLKKIWGVKKDITEIKKNHFKLIKLFDIESFIGNLSKKLIRINAENYSQLINECMRELGIFMKVERGYFFWNSQGSMNRILEWSSKDMAQTSNRDFLSEDEVRALIRVLDTENCWIGNMEDNYGELYDSVASKLKLRGIQSILISGIKKGDNLIGILVYESISQKKTWKKEDIELLKIFGDMLSIVTERIEIQKELIRKDESLQEFYNRMSQDLEVARITQKNIVTLNFPKNPLFQVTSFFKPYDKIGGDIISYYENENRIDILFGDVSGHGLSSAMVSGMVVLSFKNSARLKNSPRVILNHLNRDLKEIVLTHHISAISTSYFMKEKKIVYSYAGHPPIVLSRKGEILELEGMNTPLLTLEDVSYFESEMDLLSGDRIIYFSDGCFEVFNSDKQFLGLHSFLEILAKNQHIANSAEFIQTVIRKVTDYCKDDIRDDLTMLVLDIA